MIIRETTKSLSAANFTGKKTCSSSLLNKNRLFMIKKLETKSRKISLLDETALIEQHPFRYKINFIF